MMMAGRLLSLRLTGLPKRIRKWTTPSISRQSVVLPKCKYMSTATSAFPTVVLDNNSLRKITLRQMSKGDLDYVNELIKTRKLTDFSESDIYSVIQSPDFTGIVAENEAKEIVGFHGLIHYNADFVVGGHQVVEDALRRKGLGVEILKQIEIFVGDMPAYAFGSDVLEDYYNRARSYLDRNYRVFYKLAGTFNKTYIQAEVECGADILKADEVDFNDLFLYDRSIHTEPRHPTLHAMCFHPTSTAYVAVRKGKIVGYAVLRECYHLAFKIAPLFADDPRIAHALFQKLATHIPQQCKVCMFVSSRNDYTASFMDSNEFEVVRTLWRTVGFTRRSVNISVDFNKVFCLTDGNFAIC